MVKLTPNVTDVRAMARAAKRGGADGLSADQHHQLDHGHRPRHLGSAARRRWRQLHGGYCGPAVKPIALNMVAAGHGRSANRRCPISGIGGIQAWHDAVEFLLLGLRLGAGLHGGHALRLSDRRRHGRAASRAGCATKGFDSIDDFRGLSVPRITAWSELDLNYKIVARIDQEKCIDCGLCYIACWDGAHQCIHLDRVTGR